MLFTSNAYVKSGTVTNRSGNTVDISSWPPFLRVLLSTDGTVTKSLEAFFWEPVSVQHIQQAIGPLDHHCPDIARYAGDEVLGRSVCLRGEKTNNTYALADSFLRLETLPKDLKDDLVDGKIGIGELLRECGLETYREILDLGETTREIDGKQQACVWRVYRILTGHSPIMRISEVFPLRVYQRL